MIQDNYLTQLQQTCAQVSVYLINGIKLSGVIDGFDQYTILLKDNKNTVNQLIYKHAISTIVPSRNSASTNE